ncbi:dna mismatch repair protein [Lasallia pustulata]|uniref:Dna mismatch repair protein n=1 Tax=Lasallia pustulata TaxID=136370 RepID=A0A1W5DA76_9LECA|nr:dna mismatch repair protein [Lasallia pustulata]
MRKFENCVLLTRVGGFYELYFEHAEEYGPLLNLKIAQKKTTAGPVPMAGFPFFQLDRFLKILVQDLNKYVAISEEYANNASAKVKSGGLLFDRKVARIISPGTLIDEKFMDPYENNFLMAIHPMDNDTDVETSPDGLPVELIKDAPLPRLAYMMVGLAWLDLSTGDFYTQSTTMGALPSVIARVGAKEIVLNKTLGSVVQENILTTLEHDRHLVTYHLADLEAPSMSDWAPMLEVPVSAATQATFSGGEVAAGSLLLSYVDERLQGLGIKLQPPVRRHDTDTMSIDKNSMRGLEVLETSRDGLAGGKGSLLHVVRRTVTKSGTRLLKDWLASPSTSLSIINSRLDLVEKFHDDLSLREDVVSMLRRSYDAQRLVQKFALGRGDADDLVSLQRTIEATRGIANILQGYNSSLGSPSKAPGDKIDGAPCLQKMSSRLSLSGPSALAARIAEVIDEEGLSESHRIEENEGADMLSLAQEVLSSEGTSEDMEALSRVARSKANTKASKEQDVESEDTWIMRTSASATLQRLHDKLGDLCREKASLTANLRQQLGAQSLSLRWTPGLGHICHIKGTKDVRTSLESFANARSVSSSKTTRSFYLSDWSTLGTTIDQTKLQIRAEEHHVFQALRHQVIRNLIKLRRNAAVLDQLDIACAFALLAREQSYVRPLLNRSTAHKIIAGRHPTVTQGLQEQGRAFVANDCFVGDPHRLWLLTGPNMAGKSTFLRQNALICILAQTGSFVPAAHAELGVVDKLFSRVGAADNLFADQSTFMVEMVETAAILREATSRSFVVMDEVGRGTTPEDGVAVGRGVNRRSHALKVARLAGIPESAIQTARKVLEELGETSEGVGSQADDGQDGKEAERLGRDEAG